MWAGMYNCMGVGVFGCGMIAPPSHPAQRRLTTQYHARLSTEPTSPDFQKLITTKMIVPIPPTFTFLVKVSSNGMRYYTGDIIQKWLYKEILSSTQPSAHSSRFVCQKCGYMRCGNKQHLCNSSKTYCGLATVVGLYSNHRPFKLMSREQMCQIISRFYFIYLFLLYNTLKKFSQRN